MGTWAYLTNSMHLLGIFHTGLNLGHSGAVGPELQYRNFRIAVVPERVSAELPASVLSLNLRYPCPGAHHWRIF